MAASADATSTVATTASADFVAGPATADESFPLDAWPFRVSPSTTLPLAYSASTMAAVVVVAALLLGVVVSMTAAVVAAAAGAAECRLLF